MIEVLPSHREDVLEFNVTGTVSESDYTRVLIPVIEQAIAEQDHIRLLVRFDEDFAGYTPAAMLEDARLGIRHWRGFERVAVVTDTPWLVSAIRAFRLVMPCPVLVFPLGEDDEARRWLTESLGAVHQRDLGNGVLHVQLLGRLDPAAYAGEDETLNAFIRANGRIRLLLDLREFDGWHSLGAIGQHAALVRDHRMFVQKLAIVGTNALERMAKRLAPLFVNADVEYFDAADFAKAEKWIRTG